jgi:hypothetical protein
MNNACAIIDLIAWYLHCAIRRVVRMGDAESSDKDKIGTVPFVRKTVARGGDEVIGDQRARAKSDNRLIFKLLTTAQTDTFFQGCGVETRVTSSFARVSFLPIDERNRLMTSGCFCFRLRCICPIVGIVNDAIFPFDATNLHIFANRLRSSVSVRPLFFRLALGLLDSSSRRFDSH